MHKNSSRENSVGMSNKLKTSMFHKKQSRQLFPRRSLKRYDIYLKHEIKQTEQSAHGITHYLTILHYIMNIENGQYYPRAQ